MTRDELLTATMGRADFPPGDAVLETVCGEHVLSHLDVYWRSVVIDDVEWEIGAVGQVATAPDYRRLGLASNLVWLAVELARRRRVPALMLWSSYLSFYERFGFVATRVENLLAAPLGWSADGGPNVLGVVDPRGQW